PLAWALDQAGTAFPVEEEQAALLRLLDDAPARPPVVRCALARLAARWPHADGERWLRGLLDDPDPEVRLEALRGLNRRPGAGLDRATLARLLQAEEPALRAEAVRSAFPQGCGEELLAPLAADADARVRACLAECLAGAAEPWAAGLLARLQADAHP